MNPVDHVSLCTISSVYQDADNHLSSLTVVVTINISAKLPPYLDTLPKAKRLVSLLPGEPVCCVELRRRRTRFDGSLGCTWCVVGTLTAEEVLSRRKMRKKYLISIQNKACNSSNARALGPPLKDSTWARAARLLTYEGLMSMPRLTVVRANFQVGTFWAQPRGRR